MPHVEQCIILPIFYQNSYPFGDDLRDVFFTCALFQSIGKLERFQQLSLKVKPSFLSLHCFPIQPPSLYFIQGNKYTRVFLVFFHSAAVPLKRSFYVKPFCTNYSSWLLTGWCWNSIWNPDFGIQSAFCFCVNGIPELFYPLSKKFFWLRIISTGSGPTACQMSDFYPFLVKLEQLRHNTHLHPEVFQPTVDSRWHSEESNEQSS